MFKVLIPRIHLVFCENFPKILKNFIKIKTSAQIGFEKLRPNFSDQSRSYLTVFDLISPSSTILTISDPIWPHFNIFTDFTLFELIWPYLLCSPLNTIDQIRSYLTLSDSISQYFIISPLFDLIWPYLPFWLDLNLFGQIRSYLTQFDLISPYWSYLTQFCLILPYWPDLTLFYLLSILTNIILAILFSKVLNVRLNKMNKFYWFDFRFLF